MHWSARGGLWRGRGRPWAAVGLPHPKVARFGRGPWRGRGRPWAAVPASTPVFFCQSEFLSPRLVLPLFFCFSVPGLFFRFFLGVFFVPDLLFHEFCTLRPPGQKFRLQRLWDCLRVLVLAPVGWGGGANFVVGMFGVVHHPTMGKEGHAYVNSTSLAYLTLYGRHSQTFFLTAAC